MGIKPEDPTKTNEYMVEGTRSKVDRTALKDAATEWKFESQCLKHKTITSSAAALSLQRNGPRTVEANGSKTDEPPHLGSRHLHQSNELEGPPHLARLVEEAQHREAHMLPSDHSN